MSHTRHQYRTRHSKRVGRYGTYPEKRMYGGAWARPRSVGLRSIIARISSVGCVGTAAHASTVPHLQHTLGQYPLSEHPLGQYPLPVQQHRLGDFSTLRAAYAMAEDPSSVQQHARARGVQYLVPVVSTRA
eukprot:3941592-Rhodomonas_salina.3